MCIIVYNSNECKRLMECNRMKTTKESVFEFVQKQLMTNSDYKDGISTKVIADYFQL